MTKTKIFFNETDDIIDICYDNVFKAVEPRHALALRTLQIPQTSRTLQSLQIIAQSQNQPLSKQKRFRNQRKNTISSIIGKYKSAVTNDVHRLGYDFKWQPRFHDRIIRNEGEYQHIINYIVDNPKNWETDKFHTKTERILY